MPETRINAWGIEKEKQINRTIMDMWATRPVQDRILREVHK